MSSSSATSAAVRDALGLDFNEAMKWLDRETGIERAVGNGAYVEPVVRKKSNGSLLNSVWLNKNLP